MEELLSLKWKNHCSTFIQLLGIIRGKQMFTDVTLTCSGKFYGAHKMVLTACSEYFKEIFEHTDCKKPVIVLKGITCEDLEALLDYMYMGEVNVKQCDLSSLIKAAECLQIKGLAVADDDPPEKDLANKPQISPTPKRKRKITEDTLQPSSPKNFKKDKNQFTKSKTKDPVELTIVQTDESKPIFVKEEFSESDPLIVEEAIQEKIETFNDENIENSAYTEQASTSHTQENYYSEPDALAEMSPYQDNSSEWQGSDANISYSSDFGALDNGREQAGKVKKAKICHSCNKEFTRMASLRRHLRIHTGDNSYLCEHCSYRTYRTDKMKQHIFTKHNWMDGRPL